MLWGFLVSGEKRGIENRMDLPSGGDTEMEGCVRDDSFHFKGACYTVCVIKSLAAHTQV